MKTEAEGRVVACEGCGAVFVVGKACKGRFCSLACANSTMYDPIRRITNSVVISPSGCWEWQGCLDHCGYPVMGMGRVSRVMLEILIGPLLPGEQALHKCDNPPCINPAHLFAGTHTDNMRDMARKGRSSGRLTEDEARAILESVGSHAAIARRFGVSESLVRMIRRGERWSHLARAS